MDFFRNLVIEKAALFFILYHFEGIYMCNCFEKIRQDVANQFRASVEDEIEIIDVAVQPTNSLYVEILFYDKENRSTGFFPRLLRTNVCMICGDEITQEEYMSYMSKQGILTEKEINDRACASLGNQDDVKQSKIREFLNTRVRKFLFK